MHSMRLKATKAASIQPLLLRAVLGPRGQNAAITEEPADNKQVTRGSIMAHTADNLQGTTGRSSTQTPGLH